MDGLVVTKFSAAPNSFRCNFRARRSLRTNFVKRFPFHKGVMWWKKHHVAGAKETSRVSGVVFRGANERRD